MLSFLRANAPPRRHTANLTSITYEEGRSSQTFHPASSSYFTTHSIPPNLPTPSFFNPPLHLHLFQTEQFDVSAGTGIWYQPTHPSPAMRTLVRGPGDPPIDLPAGTYHRFANASDTETLEVRLRVDPPGTNLPEDRWEDFLRNFFGYLDDCRENGSAPSIFQLELFLHTVDGPLAIPVPGPDAVKWWVSRVTMLVRGGNSRGVAAWVSADISGILSRKAYGRVKRTFELDSLFTVPYAFYLRQERGSRSACLLCEINQCPANLK